MIRQLQQAVDYIEANIDSALNLDMISNHVGFSKYYLNHVFSIYTGFSLMAYVRKKKLEYGVGELKTYKRILDIALECGYASERAFSRAVANEYGHPPSYFRKHDVLKTRNIVFYSLDLDADEARILSGFPPTFETIKQNVELKGIDLMKQYLSSVKYERIESMVVLSGTAIGNEPEDAIIGTMNRLAIAYGLDVLRSFGFDSPVEGTEDVTKLRGYEFWLSIDESMLSKLPDPERFMFEDTEVTVKRVPGYRYATLRITDPMVDPFERIGTGWRFLVSWLEDRDFKEPDFKFNSNANCLEEVKMVDGVMVMDIYIPVDVA